MTCGSCGFPNVEGARFCGNCGVPLERTCPSCGAPLTPGLVFCTSCGARLEEAPGTRAVEERKVVSVLFADLVGFTGRAEQLDPEDVRRMLSPYYARLRDEIERFGGTVEKFIGDAVMALFGAPVAHEDDPERAVRAALAIRAAVAELSDAEAARLHVRIAVNTGEALVALGARTAEGEGMAAGDVVNTASRLQAAAPVDGILVGEATYRATERAIEYRPAPPVEAKGKAEPITVWEAVAARDRFGVDVAQLGGTDLVGRGEELDLLRDALSRARRERSSELVTLVGVPGIGKSRLVYELFKAVDEEPDLIYWRQGRSLPYGEGVTFWALSEMTKAHAGILETDSGAEAESKLAQVVADAISDAVDREWILGHLRPLVGLGGEPDASSDRRAEAFAAWRKFFEALAEARPLVLVFEDLQWADDGLLNFVDHLVEWASGVPLLCVCTARPELLERRPEWGGGKRNAATVSLSPLSDDDTARIVSALLDQAALPVEVQQPLLARAGGNPLYTEEYVRMLQDRGYLRRDGGTWQLVPGDLPLPETVQGTIAARIDALPAEEKEILQAASVLGKVVWVGTLASMAGLPRWTVEERLHALERKDFVRRESRSSVARETQYAFRHVLVRDVAYSQIPRAQRAEKHRLVAEWIDSLGERSEDRAEMLAHHYLAALEFAAAAGETKDALAEPARHALKEAGDRAWALTSGAAAVRFYGAALDLWPEDDPERAHVLLRACWARWGLGNADAEPVVEARDALLAANDRGGAADAEVLLANIAWYAGDQRRVSEHMARAIELVRDEPPSAAKATVLYQASRFDMLADHSERAIEIGRLALSIADELGLDSIRAGCLNNVGIARAYSGDLGGIADLEQAVAIAEKSRNGWEGSRSNQNLAECLFWIAGDTERAYEHYAVSNELARLTGLSDAGLRWAAAQQHLSWYWQGDWESALRGCEEFIAEVETGNPHYQASSEYSLRARIREARGEIAGALADARAAVTIGRRAGDPQNLLPAIAVNALVAARSGEPREAAGLLEELVSGRAGERLDSRHVLDLALTALELGQARDVLALFEQAALYTPWQEAAAATLRGDLAGAADRLASIGVPPAEAEVRLGAAQAFVAEGRRAEADAQLASALAFFRTVGATAFVRRGERLLAASA